MRILCVLLSILLAPLAWADSLVIQRVTLIDATGKPAQPDMTVVVEHDRIAAIDPSKKITAPAGSQIVDGRGKFLIPGLWDMHVHGFATPDGGWKWTYPLYLANGVVGVREMFGPPDANAWRKQHATYDKPAPAVYLASPILDGPESHLFSGEVKVADEAQARAAVDLYAARGADFIKVYSLLPRAAYLAIADEARKRGISFVGHVPDAIRVEEASDAGQKSMEHLLGMALGTSSQEEALFDGTHHSDADSYRINLRAYGTYDESRAAALFARFIKNGTWQCPTLVTNRFYAYLDDDQYRLMHREWLKYVPQETQSFFKRMTDSASKEMRAADWANAHRVFLQELKLVGRMYRAGVGILAGTDSPYSFAGFSLHDELALLVEAGLPPMAALQAATINPARFMGVADRRGTIEVGKVADLVLLDRNPLVDIHNSTSIHAVILGGKLLTRASLDTMLAEVEAAAAKPASSRPGSTTR